MSASSIHRVYADLHACFGSQGWWPTTPPGEIRPRYYPGSARDRLSPGEQWEIAVGALLTQNTAWCNVEQALANLSTRSLLDLPAMAALPADELALLIRPSGYYNQKARRLHHLASYIIDIYGGDIGNLLSRPPAELRRELLALEGIGPETADSILLYAARYPFFVIDAYTRRIFGLLGRLDPDLKYAEMQSIFMDHLPRDPDLFAEYHALLVKLATTSCKTRPQCADCCLRTSCRHAASLREG